MSSHLSLNSRISACFLSLVVYTDEKGSKDLLFKTVKITDISKRIFKD